MELGTPGWARRSGRAVVPWASWNSDGDAVCTAHCPRQPQGTTGLIAEAGNSMTEIALTSVNAVWWEGILGSVITWQVQLLNLSSGICSWPPWGTGSALGIPAGLKQQSWFYVGVRLQHAADQLGVWWRCRVDNALCYYYYYFELTLFIICKALLDRWRSGLSTG